ncbi:unnamed protein product, partial [marine sediment metagenome]
ITLIKHSKNLGKGQSLKTGFSYIVKNNYSGVITIDADGQHKTSEIKNFLKVIEKENPDLIIGDRLGNTKNMPFIRLATNVFTSWVISNIAGIRISDVQSGFRYISTKALKNIKLETRFLECLMSVILKFLGTGIDFTTSKVLSVEPSSTMTMSSLYLKQSLITPLIYFSSL